MKNSKLIAFAAMGLTAVTSVSAQEVATWKGFKSAAVTLSFDDNLAYQVSKAAPVLDQYGFKATFNVVIDWLNTNYDNYFHWDKVIELAANGHEIASHTISHNNAAASDYEMKQSKADIINRTKGECVTIAYPYCTIPNKNDCAKYYISGRVCNNQIESNKPQDFFAIGSIICGTTGVNDAAGLTKQIEQAKQKKGWVTFLIHDMQGGSGYSPLSMDAFNGMVSYLHNNEYDYWVCTFAQATKYIKERESAKVTIKDQSATQITMSVTDDLADDIFNEPLTIRVPLPEGWSEVSAAQGDEDVPVSTDGSYIYVDAVPDRGDVIIVSGTAAVADPEVMITAPASPSSLVAGAETEVTWTLDGEVKAPLSLYWNMAGTEKESATSAKASSEWATEDGTFSWKVSNILSDDGNNGESSRWGAMTSENEWVELSFAKQQMVAGLYVDEFTEYGHVTKFEVQIPEGDGWATVYEGETIGKEFACSFAPTSTSKVRLSIISAEESININYVAAILASSTLITGDISSTGSYKLTVPNDYLGSEVCLTIAKPSGKVLASAGPISIVNEATSVDQVDASASNAVVNISFADGAIVVNSSEKIERISLIDMSGRVVKSVANEDTVLLSGLSSGVYVVNVKTLSGNAAFRIDVAAK